MKIFANINFIFLLACYKTSYFNCWYFKMCLGGLKWVIQEQFWLRVFYPVSLSVSSFVEFSRFNDLFCLWQYFFWRKCMLFLFSVYSFVSLPQFAQVVWLFVWLCVCDQSKFLKCSILKMTKHIFRKYKQF